jgi:hypothetical protein
MPRISAIPHFPDYQITQLPNPMALTVILPLCHSERCRSIRDGERGTPRMSAAQMPSQGILSRIPLGVPSCPLWLKCLTFRSRRSRRLQCALVSIPRLRRCPGAPRFVLFLSLTKRSAGCPPIRANVTRFFALLPFDPQSGVLSYPLTFDSEKVMRCGKITLCSHNTPISVSPKIRT